MTCKCMANNHKKVFNIFSNQGNKNYYQIEILYLLY